MCENRPVCELAHDIICTLNSREILWCDKIKYLGIDLIAASLQMFTSHNRATSRAVAVMDVSLSQLAPRIHQFANCHRERPAGAVRYTSRVDYLTA